MGERKQTVAPCRKREQRERELMCPEGARASETPDKLAPYMRAHPLFPLSRIYINWYFIQYLSD